MSERSNETVGVLLAGGQSSRMGKDKARLQLQGKTLLERCSSILLETGVNRVIVSGGQYQGGVVDCIPNKGPLGGIHSVLQSENIVSAKGLLISTVDMPAMKSELLKQLLVSGLACEKACIFEHHPFPMYLPNTTEVKTLVNTCLIQGELAVKHLLDKIGFESIENPDPFTMTNVNRPEEWQRFNQYYQESIGLVINE